MSNKDYGMMRVWPGTLTRLKLLAASQNISMIAMLHKLVTDALTVYGLEVVPVAGSPEEAPARAVPPPPAAIASTPTLLPASRPPSPVPSPPPPPPMNRAARRAAARRHK